jgi:hypothetical protein
VRQTSEPRRPRPTRLIVAAAAAGFAVATVMAVTTANAWADAGAPCAPDSPACITAAPANGSGSALGSAVHERDLATAQDTAGSGPGTARTVVLGGALIVIGAGAVVGSLQTRGRSPASS